jgi:hypothetical protein
MVVPTYQKTTAPSVGYLALNTILWECKGIARGYPMQSYRVDGYGRPSLLLFPKHLIL